MKTGNFKSLLMAGVGAVFFAMNVPAQDAAPQLSPAVAQVVQLAQAKVGDDTIIAYIQNSGTIYGLDANQIVYLKQQGVSSSVITTMLNQRTRLAGTSVQTAAQPTDSNVGSASTSTAVAQPTVTYETVPSSSVYVIPDTQTYDYNAYYYQPYYYPSYGYYYPYPAVSLSFGFGGRRGGGWRGGGGFHGGGWHH